MDVKSRMWHRVIATTQQQDLDLSRTSHGTDPTSSQGITEVLEASHLTISSPALATSPTQRSSKTPNANMSHVNNNTGILNEIP